MAIFFVLGILLLLYGSFAISGEHLHNPMGNFLFLIVLIAFGLLCLIAIAAPAIRRLPKGFREIIDDDLREDGSFDTAQHAIAICMLKDNKLVQLIAEDETCSIPIKLINDSLHLESALNSFAVSLGLPVEDLAVDTDYRAYLPGVKELVTCHVYRCAAPTHISGKNKLVDSSDIAALNPLEKQLVLTLKEEGIIV